MAWTAAQAMQALEGGGWDLLRMRTRGPRTRERWRVTSPVHGEDYTFWLLDEVERFWRGCYVGLLEAEADALFIGRLHAENRLGLRDTIIDWLAKPGERMASVLSETLKDQRQAVRCPWHWKQHAAHAGLLPARGKHDLRALVEQELIRRESAHLAQTLPDSTVRPVLRRL